VKFIDEATITVQSGKGGAGCVSFRRERFIPRGGPDGGNGGRGGDIVLRSTSRKRTLSHFQFKREFKARDGARGLGQQKTGKNGQSVTIEIPPGTVVYNSETGALINDFTQPDESLVVARGGRGGLGNSHFKSSTHQAPRFAQPGEPAACLTLKLELKLLADVGIVGLPNAGKSTLISAISSARPKIGGYPFTTLSPHLGVVRAGSQAPFVVADIPGLIEGAHAGTGLGTQFLRHIERTRVLLHLIDASAITAADPLHPYRIVQRELSLYERGVAQKPQLLVLNKIDIPEALQAARWFQSAVKDREVLLISAATGQGVEDLKRRIARLLEACHAA
jgi:GTP-binding protein